MTAAAREPRVARRLGNQGHSSDDIRRAVEWIREGSTWTSFCESDEKNTCIYANLHDPACVGTSPIPRR